jgi:hypothetical protein
MALSLDGHDVASAAAPASPFAIQINDPTNGDILVACVTLESTVAQQTVTGITDVNGNTWQKRNSFQYTSPVSGAFVDNEIWWAYCPGNISFANVTIAFSGTADAIGVSVFGVKGFTGTAYHTNPWDQTAVTAAGFINDSISATASAPTTLANVATLNAGALVFGFGATSDSVGAALSNGTIGGSTPTIGFGPNQGGTVNAARHVVECLVEASTISGSALNLTGTQHGWVMFADALAPAGFVSGGDTLMLNQGIVFM